MYLFRVFSTIFFRISLIFLFYNSNQLCINTAIVYMHRFYAFHSFTQFHQNGIAMASLFLAAKVKIFVYSFCCLRKPGVCSKVKLMSANNFSIEQKKNKFQRNLGGRATKKAGNCYQCIK